MPPQEQADLWMALRDRMKVDWNEMTLQEKKAGMLTSLLSYWITGVQCAEYRIGSDIWSGVCRGRAGSGH